MKTNILKKTGLGLLSVMLLFSSFTSLSSLEQSNAQNSYTDFTIYEKVTFNEDGTFSTNISPESLTLNKKSRTLGAGETLPAKYDMRVDDPDLLTSVDDQGVDGLCWAYANRAVIETSLKKDGLMATGSPKISVKHLLNSTFNQTTWSGSLDTMLNNGASSMFVLNGLSRKYGPTLETAFPSTDIRTNKMTSLTDISKYDSLLKDMFVVNRTDKAAVKNAIVEHGALSLAVRSVAYGSYATNKNLYCPNNANPNEDHNITIIGWDDDYSKNNFVSQGTPTNNGAWIIRNSWGTGIGESGYQYISYEDTAIDDIAFGFDFEAKNNTNDADNMYFYDDCGYIQAMDLQAQKNVNISNVYTSTKNEVLKQVSIYVEHAGNYDVKIYKGVGSNPETGTLAKSQSGTFDKAGFHKINLTSTVDLLAGEKFSIVFTLYNTQNISLEGSMSAFTSNMQIVTGQSYYREVGQSYIDLYTMLNGMSGALDLVGNFDIKAYTDDDPDQPTTPTALAVNISTLKFTIGTRVYTGGYVKPAITIKTATGKALKEGVDYTVRYNFNKLPGNAKVEITGKGKYTGVVNKTYRIYPKASKVAVKYVKKNVYSISWARSTGTTKYVLYYRKGSGKWKTKLFAASKLKVSFIKFKGKYQFKIRSYKTVGSLKLYSAYSKVVKKTLK